MQIKNVAYSLVALPLAAAQLTGKVGPTNPVSQQPNIKVCNVMNYGGEASKTGDIGPAIGKAWNDCKVNGIVYIPPGDYGMSTWQILTGGSNSGIQLDGIIYRVGTAGGHMFNINHSSDFEFFSSTAKGAIQGFGYEFHKDNKYGPRIMRLVQLDKFAVHGAAFVDSPAFHLIVDNCTNGEIYNMIIR